MTSVERIHWTAMETPIGRLLLAADSAGLRRVDFDGDIDRFRAEIGGRSREPLEDADLFGSVAALRRYFAGELEALAEIAAIPEGTPFQERVWSALRRIPAGEVVTYGGLAADLGSRGASRAVGAANGRNPIPVVIPCHRVVAAGGGLGGYGGGLERKLWLLRHEGAWPRAEASEREGGFAGALPGLGPPRV